MGPLMKSLTSTLSVLPAVMVVLFAPQASRASLQRDNEQGISPTHSYTQLGPGEVVSNLNGNLVLTIPVADVASASPLGIHLERSYNSHWRDPLVVHQFDVVNKGGYGWRNTPDWVWNDVSLDAGDQSFGGIFQKTNYSNPGKSLASGNAATSAAIGYEMADGAYRLTAAGENAEEAVAGGQPAAIGATMTWASTTFAAAGLIVEVAVLADHQGPMTNREKVNAAVGIPVGLAAVATSLAWNDLGQAGQAAAGKAFAVIGLALHVYNFVQYEDNAEPWDPGYSANQVIMPLSLGMDVVGTALVLWGGPVGAAVGVGLIATSAVLQLGGQLWAMHEAAKMQWDIGEVRVEPWALSVNGYVGMLGNKLPQDWGVPAYPFSGSPGEDWIPEDIGGSGDDSWDTPAHWEAQPVQSVHPMPDLYLIRSGGGADRFLLQPYDGGVHVTDVEEHWYAYKAMGAESRTQVYYCDRPPYQNVGRNGQSGQQIIDPADPNDYYLVKEADGTWARFGVGATKGVDVVSTEWGGLFETYWALPNSIHHFSGDSLTISRDANLNVTEVLHSRDPRKVTLSRTGEHEDAQVVRSGQVLTDKVIDWTPITAEMRRHQASEGSRVKITAEMPTVVTVPVDGSHSLSTRYSWDQGDLSEVDYPDGSKTAYEWYHDVTNSAGPLDGFLHRRTQFAQASGAGARVEYLFTHRGWVSSSDPSGTQGLKEGDQTGILYTDLTRSMSTPAPTGAAAVSSTTNRYRFQYRQENVNVRNKPSTPLSLDPDTTLSDFSQVITDRLQLQTAWEGIEGAGLRTDYVWDGDRLVMKLTRPGIDTVFAPKVELYTYDRLGALTTRQVNPADEMGRLEWISLISLSGAAQDTTLTQQQLVDMISAKIHKPWQSRFDTLDLTEIHAWHHEDKSELVRDTAFLRYNPNRGDDSIQWLTVHHLSDSLARLVVQDSLDSICAHRGGNLVSGGCRLYHPVIPQDTGAPDLLPSAVSNDSLTGRQMTLELPGWRGSLALARPQDSSGRANWQSLPATDDLGFYSAATCASGCVPERLATRHAHGVRKFRLAVCHYRGANLCGQHRRISSLSVYE